MADAIDDGLIKALVEAVRAFLREGTRVAQRSDEFLTVVIERKDKSDPHWKLCEALEAYDAAELRKARALSRHKAPLSVMNLAAPSEGSATFDLCMATGALIVATDGNESIRAERQVALDAMERVARGDSTTCPQSVREILSDCAEFLSDIDDELALRCEAALTALQVTEGDEVGRLIEARKVVAKEYRRLGLNPNPVLRGDFDAGVEVQAALRSQYNKVSKPL